MHKLAPNGVKECRNRSANLINRKRTNFCIEATPPKNSHRKKIVEKNPSEIYFFWKMPKIWEFFRFWKLISKYIGNFRKFYHFLKKIITFSKIWNFQDFPIFLKKKLTFSNIMLKVQKFSDILKFLKNREFSRFWKLIF